MADGGWDFTARVSVPGGFSWILPRRRPASQPPQTTGDGGMARFLWRPTDLDATSTVDVVDETNGPGYTYVSSTCDVKSVRRSAEAHDPADLPTHMDGSRDLGPASSSPAGVQQDQPGDDQDREGRDAGEPQAFDFTGSLGAFTLVDDRADESVSRTFTDLTPGTYTVSELVPEDWELTGIACTPEAAATITGAEVDDHARHRRVPSPAPSTTGGSIRRCRRSRRSRRPPPPDPPGPPTPLTPPEPRPRLRRPPSSES